MMNSEQDPNALLTSFRRVSSEELMVSKALWIIIIGTFIFGVGNGLVISYFFIK